MRIIPFGEVEKDRFDICKRYKLLECVNGIWRVTEKCKKNYEFESFYKYLKGDIIAPQRIDREGLIKSLLEL